jgi:hypothetical protein
MASPSRQGTRPIFRQLTSHAEPLDQPDFVR